MPRRVSRTGLLLVTCLVLGRAAVHGDDGATAAVSGVRAKDQVPCVFLGGLHLPQGGMVWTQSMMGLRVHANLWPGDYLVVQPAEQSDEVWLTFAGSAERHGRKEGPKVYVLKTIYAELLPADGETEPDLSEPTDGFRNADYHRPDGLIVRLKIAAR